MIWRWLTEYRPSYVPSVIPTDVAFLCHTKLDDHRICRQTWVTVSLPKWVLDLALSLCKVALYISRGASYLCKAEHA
jgi:hypothetical protein